jgi:TonB family protein
VYHAGAGRLVRLRVLVAILAATSVLATLVGSAVGDSSSAPASASAPSIVKPRIASRVDPVYPAEALAGHLQADVPVLITIDATGAVATATVAAPAGHGFDEAALAAVRQFRFSPALVAGVPTPVQVTYVVHFRLTPKPASAPASIPAAPVPGVLASRAPVAASLPASPGSQPARGPVRSVLAIDLREKGTRAPLGDAIVTATLSGRQVTGTTDEDGQVELELGEAGTFTVDVDAPAHGAVESNETVAAGQSLQVVYYLERTDYSDYRTVVRVRPVRQEISRTSLSADEVLYIPGTGGDLLRSVQTLPGVARASGLSGDLVILGSAPSDSAIFLGGGILPQLFHFGSLASVFSSFLIDHLDYLPSNFGPRYGRVTGGVVDVTPRPGRSDRLHAFADLNLIDGSAMIDGPVGKGSFALAARRSIIDGWLALAPPAWIVEAPVYYDYQAELTQPLLGGTLNVLLFGSDDQLKLLFAQPSSDDPAIRGQFGTHLSFHFLEPTWDLVDGAFRVHLSVETGPSNEQASAGPVSFDVRYWDTFGRADLSYKAQDWLTVEGGLDIADQRFSGDSALPLIPSETAPDQPLAGQPIFHAHEQGGDFQPAAWYQLDLSPVPGLLVMPGGRVDWDSYTRKLSVDPRLGVRYRVLSDTTLKGGLGIYHEIPQPFFYVDRTYGNPALPPQRAVQSSLGVEQQLGDDFYAEATGFYKWLSDYPANTSTLVARDGAIVPEIYAPTKIGRVYGVQVLARKNFTARWFGWLAYTLEKTERQDAPGQPWYPFEFDQTHILTAVASYRITPQWQLGARVIYSTGNVETPVVGGIYDADADVYRPIAGPPNSSRLPAYSEIDVRLDKRWIFDTWMLDLYLDVRNVLNRHNVEGYAYNYDYTQSTAVTGLPIVPSLGIRGEF